MASRFYPEKVTPDSDRVFHAFLVTITNLVELESFEVNCQNLVLDFNFFEKLAQFISLNPALEQNVLLEISQFFETFSRKINSPKILPNLSNFIREIKAYILAGLGDS